MQISDTGGPNCLIGGDLLKNTDHRVRVTRMLIRQAFTKLLQQKPIQSISIKELCAAAGINRGTFYAHYTDIYDLLAKIEQEMFGEIQEALQPLLEEARPLNPVDISTGIFQCLKDNSDLCIVTLGPYGDKAFAAKLLELGRERCQASYSQYFRRATPEQISYYYAFVSAGCIGLLDRWLQDGMRAPAGEIARIAQEIMLSGIGFLQDRQEETP